MLLLSLGIHHGLGMHHLLLGNHVVLLHDHGLSNWVELGVVSHLSRIGCHRVLLHGLEWVLLGDASHLSLVHSFRVFVISCSVDFVLEESLLAIAGGQWVLSVIVVAEVDGSLTVLDVLSLENVVVDALG